MKYLIELAATAKADIRSQAHWLFDHVSPATADKWLNGLYKAIDTLQTRPSRCQFPIGSDRSTRVLGEPQVVWLTGSNESRLTGTALRRETAEPAFYLDRLPRSSSRCGAIGSLSGRNQTAGFPCSRYCAVERVEDLLGGPGWAEDLVQQGSRLLAQGELGQRLAGSIAGTGGFERGGCIDRGASGGGALPAFTAASSSSDCRRSAGSTGFRFRRGIVGGERRFRRPLGRGPIAQAPLAEREVIAGSSLRRGVRGRGLVELGQQSCKLVTSL